MTRFQRWLKADQAAERRNERLRRGDIVDAIEQVAADFAAHGDHEGNLLANAFWELGRALS